MSDKKQLRIVLFLGAGASKPFGKPTTKEFKDILRDEKYHPSAPSNLEPWQKKILNSILSFEEFKDIEHVLQCLKEIDEFFTNSQYGGKYLQSKNLVYDKGNQWDFSQYIENVKTQRGLIERDIFEYYHWNHSKEEELGQKIYDQLFAEIMKHSNSNVIRIFTTNYDRTIEEYCSSEQRNYQFIDGFIPHYRSGRRKWNEGKYEAPLDKGEVPVYLYKLHGSLDWKRHKQYGILATGEEGPSSDSNYIEQMLVYPTLSPKDGQEVEPYKTIREKFKEELMKRTDVCIVIGFSFRDEHIKSILSDFLKLGTKTLIVVSPSAKKNIHDNLLRKPIPSAQKTTLGKDKNIKIYDENGTKIITINYALSAENAEKIIKQMIGPYLSSQTGQWGPITDL
jgi:hypothetical protein